MATDKLSETTSKVAAIPEGKSLGARDDRAYMAWCPCCFAGLDLIEQAEEAGWDGEAIETTCDECRDDMDGDAGTALESVYGPND